MQLLIETCEIFNLCIRLSLICSLINILFSLVIVVRIALLVSSVRKMHLIVTYQCFGFFSF